MTSPPPPVPRPATLRPVITEPPRVPAQDAAHTMALVSATTAVVSLAIPWMTEGYGRNDLQAWNGWFLYRGSMEDGRVPLPLPVVVLLVVATFALVLVAWYWQANPQWRRGPKVVPWVGVAYLAAGLYLLDLITHDYDKRPPDQAAGGIVLWLLSVLLFTSAAGRLRSIHG